MSSCKLSFQLCCVSCLSREDIKGYCTWKYTTTSTWQLTQSVLLKGPGSRWAMHAWRRSKHSPEGTLFCRKPISHSDDGKSSNDLVQMVSTKHFTNYISKQPCRWPGKHQCWYYTSVFPLWCLLLSQSASVDGFLYMYILQASVWNKCDKNQSRLRYQQQPIRNSCQIPKPVWKTVTFAVPILAGVLIFRR